MTSLSYITWNARVVPSYTYCTDLLAHLPSNGATIYDLKTWSIKNTLLIANPSFAFLALRAKKAGMGKNRPGHPNYNF